MRTPSARTRCELSLKISRITDIRRVLIHSPSGVLEANYTCPVLPALARRLPRAQLMRLRDTALPSQPHRADARSPPPHSVRGRKHHRCDFTKCAKAFSVVSETWCSMPSASASADSVGTPSAHRTSTTSR